jgi:hypothetical protein
MNSSLPGSNDASEYYVAQRQNQLRVDTVKAIKIGKLISLVSSVSMFMKL